MRALTVEPGVADSARVDDLPEPDPSEGDVLVDAIALGICGTDREILAADYGEAPEGSSRLVLGHESLGRVREAPRGAPVAPGDLVAAFVRLPDPVPCPCCARDEWDMCRNGRYTEHGIKGAHGFGRERWREHPDRLVRLDPALGIAGVLLEPASVVAKAWEQIDRIAARACSPLHGVLVTGAGPIGLLAALLSVQRGHPTTVIDRVRGGRKPRIVEALGATYRSTTPAELAEKVDIVIEATGAAPVIGEVVTATRPGGIVCLTGVSPAGQTVPFDLGAVNREIVLGNGVIFGSVNANARHYAAAADALARADRGWLESLLTRCVPLNDHAAALEHRDGDVKVVVELGPETA
jgi:threonine dehydrogenase-like Zn-dependent dehydrogenase